MSANAVHGIRRTNEDKRRAVTTMLTNDLVSKDERGNPWSDSAIAKRCGVSHPFVGEIRKGLGLTCNVTSEERTYTTKHGTVATMNTANIGRRETTTTVVNTDTGEANAMGRTTLPYLGSGILLYSPDVIGTIPFNRYIG